MNLQSIPSLNGHEILVWALLGLLSLGWGIDRLYRYIRGGRKAEKKELEEKIEEAVKPWRDRVESAEDLASTRKSRLAEEREQHEIAKVLLSQREAKLAEQREVIDVLESNILKTLANFEGRMRSLEINRHGERKQLESSDS